MLQFCLSGRRGQDARELKSCRGGRLRHAGGGGLAIYPWSAVHSTPRAPGRLSSSRAALAFPLPPCPWRQQATLQQATLPQKASTLTPELPVTWRYASVPLYGRERQRSRKLLVCKESMMEEPRRGGEQGEESITVSVLLVNCPPPRVHPTPTGGFHKNTSTRPAEKLCRASPVANSANSHTLSHTRGLPATLLHEHCMCEA